MTTILAASILAGLTALLGLELTNSRLRDRGYRALFSGSLMILMIALVI